MKKFIINAGLILGLAGILYILVIYLCLKFNLGSTSWMPNVKRVITGENKGGSLQKFREARKSGQVDFVVIGSSHAYRGFDPRVFEKHGLEMFNLGSNSQAVANSFYVLNEYIDILKPKYVIMETYFNASMYDGVEPTLDIVSNHPLTPNILMMSLANFDILVLNTVIANFLHRLNNPLEKEVPKKARDIKFSPERYVSGGYVEYLDKHNVIGAKGLAEIEETKIELKPKHTRHLDKIIRLCKEKNVQLVFVCTPVTKEYMQKIINYDEYNNRMKKIAAEYNIPYFDYNVNSSLQLASLTDFHDRSHLAPSGVEKFNAVFIQDLKRYLNNNSGRIN